MGRNYVRPFDICNVIYANVLCLVPLFHVEMKKQYVSFANVLFYLSIASIVLIIFKVS